jgi:hypothetical protein
MRIESVAEADLPDLLLLMRAYCDFYGADPVDEDLTGVARALIEASTARPRSSGKRRSTTRPRNGCTARSGPASPVG